MEKIEIIRKKLDDLRNLDRKFSIFGSNRHKYKLNPPLSENDIIQVERDNQITLSKEYKIILKKLGNGGAGCGYGLEKMNLKNVNPPYIGTKQLLRNCKEPQRIDCDMIELDQVSGYIKLFDFGCGMEYCLIIKGEEVESLIFFDCDGRFEKIESRSLLDIYESWLDKSLTTLKRVKDLLINKSVDDVIKEEWENKNFSIREMIYSIMNIAPPRVKHHTQEYKEAMETLRIDWLKLKIQDN